MIISGDCSFVEVAPPPPPPSIVVVALLPQLANAVVVSRRAMVGDAADSARTGAKRNEETTCRMLSMACSISFMVTDWNEFYFVAIAVVERVQ